MQASLLKFEPPDHVRLAVLDFVSSLGKLVISPDIQVILLIVVSVNETVRITEGFLGFKFLEFCGLLTVKVGGGYIL